MIKRWFNSLLPVYAWPKSAKQVILSLVVVLVIGTYVLFIIAIVELLKLLINLAN